MFNKKYFASILDVTWKMISTKVEFNFPPRINEFIFLDGSYYQINNIVHNISQKKVLVIVEKVRKENSIENEGIN